ncbi:MAG: single-stranded-DNA-specific exonuclease RecJ [Spirochaetes bacterium GWD1_61_31]|nr:MAG: single-stranded-DNA-specific exonuclease RecJ [Spirochaetes bacterium GWB1_60_80]OHD34027.1 MAG: single-stranded-DNA-specific exonuclease RecJ [Spirochaetes bacterium GWC1_61_12]OHD35202.1 MAG: single-stranded-DNA-specific exonuclease RecJ [Spirochaetes bacterium GWD1_61_31]OHD41407.1 MAG: single-stranded-DNA-specific exonuclease RecJ [Spirochaetes bacterium GWE1_60_18]OHD59204.1 MAG: single-stranded-DNA-specific exonuclease RecJ [Spirochaetes bacterium GWF1_60_12]HAP43095.1 single-str
MRWRKRDVSAARIRELADKYKLDLLTAAILARRGHSGAESLLYFLEDDMRFLRNPFLFNDMEDAVDRVLLAADEQEKVMVFGDRDVDGVTAATLLCEALQALGIEASWRLPADDEKYGLSVKAIDEHAAAFGSLIITVDCGISNHKEVEYARSKGIDVIILDHHVLQAESPPSALAVINPKLPDCGYPFRDLSGCGVVYKLAWALRFAGSGLYKQQVALLNVRPLNEAYQIEAVRLSNLVETGRLVETIVPGMVDLAQTRLVPFLADRQIMVWDGEVQKRLLAKALGRGAEVNFYDVQPEVARVISQAAGASLLRLTELSRVGRYSTRDHSELDTFISLFTSFALRKAKCFGEEDQSALQLVALSTIADIMPLLDENRILVRQGLAAMSRKPRPGLLELLQRQNLLGRQLTASEISWQLSPVINAAGRMGQPGVAVQLLLEGDAARRGQLADQLVDLNSQRRQLGAEAWDAIYPDACRQAEASGGKYVIVSSPALNRGITGIIASRLADTFKAPAVAAASLPDGTVIASVRSARNYNVKSLLEHCAELFIDFGGHDAAAGFSMPAANWPRFVALAGRFLSEVQLEAYDETIDIDAELPHDYLKPELADLITKLEPYGEAHQPLVFLARKVPVLQAEIVGRTEKSHLKFTLDFGAHRWPALWWNAADRLRGDIGRDMALDVVFQVKKNVWNGIETPQLVLLDACPAGQAPLVDAWAPPPG